MSLLGGVGSPGHTGTVSPERASVWVRVLCAITSHPYVRIRYPDSPDGYFLRCKRCGREREESYGGGYASGMDWGG